MTIASRACRPATPTAVRGSCPTMRATIRSGSSPLCTPPFCGRRKARGRSRAPRYPAEPAGSRRRQAQRSCIHHLAARPTGDTLVETCLASADRPKRKLGDRGRRIRGSPWDGRRERPDSPAGVGRTGPSYSITTSSQGRGFVRPHVIPISLSNWVHVFYGRYSLDSRTMRAQAPGIKEDFLARPVSGSRERTLLIEIGSPVYHQPLAEEKRIELGHAYEQPLADHGLHDDKGHVRQGPRSASEVLLGIEKASPDLRVSASRDQRSKGRRARMIACEAFLLIALLH